MPTGLRQSHLQAASLQFQQVCQGDIGSTLVARFAAATSTHHRSWRHSGRHLQAMTLSTCPADAAVAATQGLLFPASLLASCPNAAWPDHLCASGVQQSQVIQCLLLSIQRLSRTLSLAPSRDSREHMCLSQPPPSCRMTARRHGRSAVQVGALRKLPGAGRSGRTFSSIAEGTPLARAPCRLSAQSLGTPCWPQAEGILYVLCHALRQRSWLNWGCGLLSLLLRVPTGLLTIAHRSAAPCTI